MKTQALPDSLTGKVLTLGPANEQFALADYLRKTYLVATTDNGTGETQPHYFDNSTDANAFAGLNDSEVIVWQVNDLPKARFWDLWREFKSDLQAQGVFVTKRDGEYVVTDHKPAMNQVLQSKGYGRRCEYVSPEFCKHEMIDRDAERYDWE
jgi:hypothetical protein